MLNLHKISISSFIFFQRSLIYGIKTKKIANVHQRCKYFAKYPHLYQLRTIIKPPDLREKQIKFPINIPIRFRHIYSPKKSLYLDNTKKVHWNRLTPNEILLGLSKIQYMEFSQVIEGLMCLSGIVGQSNHDWNEHIWVNSALAYVLKNFHRIRKTDTIKFYNLMKKLNYKNPQFWKKLYAKIQYELYDLYPSFFQKIFVTYYKNCEEYFSPQMKDKMLKLMENRLRQFRPSSIIYIFEIFREQDKLNTYWLENVFIPLFKSSAYAYTPEQIGQIFRFMMIIDHENNSRLYDSLYNKITKIKFKKLQDITLLIQILQEVKQIFKSHRLQPYLTHLQKQKQIVISENQLVKKSLHQIVKQDLVYFTKKRMIKHEQNTNVM